jgi:tetratricopeptide (TPR) repeat protein
VLTCEPTSADTISCLIITANQYADFLNGEGRFAEAEKNYRRAVDVGQQLIRDVSLSIYTISALSHTQLDLANFLARNNRHQEALTDYREASLLLRPCMCLPERFPLMERAYRDANQGIFTILAILAKNGHSDEAREFCEELSKTQKVDSAAEFFLAGMLASEAWEHVKDFERARTHRMGVVSPVHRAGVTMVSDRI